jgi:hypothetical protein
MEDSERLVSRFHDVAIVFQKKNVAVDPLLAELSERAVCDRKFSRMKPIL